MPTLPVKVYNNHEIRRFRLEIGENVEGVGYERMMNEINKLFPNLESGNVRLSWKDSDGDFVLISSNAELEEAVVNLPANDNLLRLYVQVEQDTGNTTVQDTPVEKIDHKKQEPEPKAPQGQAADDDGEEEGNDDHDPSLHNATCDGCGVKIRGVRYKCTICPSIDLCFACFKKAKHPGHSMFVIKSPKEDGWKRSQNLPNGGGASLKFSTGTGTRGFSKGG